MIRLATIGTSMITGMLADAVRVVDGITIETVYSRDAAKAAAKAAEFGAAGSSDDLDAVLASPDIDAVYIASPNSEHGAQVRKVIAAGKHVLVEKPAVTTADEWLELVGSADEAGVVLLEAMRTEYDPGTALVRSLLPELGVLRAASLRYASRSSRYDLVLAGERVNMFDPAMAGGALFDLGVYCVHAMVTLLGVPESVHADVLPVPSGVDGAGTILARYPGAVVSLEYSKISTTHLPSEIQGEDATLVIDHIASPRSVRLVRRDGSEELHELTQPQHELRGEVERFVELVSTGQDAAADHDRTTETLRIIEAVRAGS
ncbi:Gfo/Idh/MocA family protein [Microbacterium terricola]|uniref:Oxidoreductase YulF n=1 Tax=Microbacterium terricola TaxID=344163 RepID=A0ABM8E3N0_9MICO|nr:Gfo/Idh/MocA family oxidoreductase [Microbacterium terricola]UYK39949.1 Gfo/Idh/MocA family oxidoreductase [Microbacterium terricola]BDV32370.1 putative oxidoreductase YulF [Microbacterium terricola]